MEVRGKAWREKDLVQANIQITLGFDSPNDELHLRVALVERTVHYTGANGLHLHKQVVRNFIGGVEGIRIIADEKDIFKCEISQGLNQLDAQLTHYVENLEGKRRAKFPPST